MKEVLKKIIIICMIASMVIGISGCDAKEKSSINSLIAEFEYACNTLDIDAMLDCIDPSVSDKIKLAVGLFGSFTDTNTDEILESISYALTSDSSIDSSDFFESINIEIEDVMIEDEYALASTILTYEISGEEYTKEATFECIYYVDKWYISYFTFEKVILE